MSSALPRPVSKLIDALSRLPGVGPKTASRLAFYMLRAPDDLPRALADALYALTDSVVTCERCFNIAETSPCAVCTDPNRQAEVVCVVEEPLDVIALERTGMYHGLYHVLNGAISPVDGITPADLRIGELLSRLQREPITEIILATNPSLEGDATAMYLERAFENIGADVEISRLARGLPVGGDIEYADEVTLGRALEGRSRVR